MVGGQRVDEVFNEAGFAHPGGAGEQREGAVMGKVFEPCETLSKACVLRELIGKCLFQGLPAREDLVVSVEGRPLVS